MIIHFRNNDTSLRLFTTIATLGTPHDVTVQEIRVECFFPIDDDTAQTFRDWVLAAPHEATPASPTDAQGHRPQR